MILGDGVDTRLKHRLAGATIIVALVVIFLPMLLEGPVKERRIDVPMDVPPAGEEAPDAGLPDKGVAEAPDPGADQEAVPEPEMPANDGAGAGETDTGATGSAETQPSASATAADQTPSSPEPAADGAPAESAAPQEGGWAVQVGGFSERANAVAVRDRLRSKGYDVYVAEAEADGNAIFRVRVGPVASRERADSLAKELSGKEGLPVLVVSR